MVLTEPRCDRFEDRRYSAIADGPIERNEEERRPASDKGPRDDCQCSPSLPFASVLDALLHSFLPLANGYAHGTSLATAVGLLRLTYNRMR